MVKKICAVSFTLLLSATMALAVDQDHSKMDHGTMNHETSTTHSMEQKHTEAMGEGIINSVSKLNRSVNITHAPIPELNWPEMKMDLAVAKGVDLNAVKAGDKVTFHVMLDDDKVYRIHHFGK